MNAAPSEPVSSKPEAPAAAPAGEQTAAPAERFRSFAAFYPFYLGEHRNTVCRRLHFVGSLGCLVCLVLLATTGTAWWLLAAVVWPYALAWIGHFVFEKNRPATFKYPLYSLIGDWVMFKDILTRKIRL